MNAIETNHETSTRYLLAKTLVFSFGLFGIGIAGMLLMLFYDAMKKYGENLKFTISAFIIVFIILLIIYVAGNIFFSLQYRAIENSKYKNDGQLLITKCESENKKSAEIDKEFVIDEYHRLNKAGIFSMNQLALSVFGKKGGKYNDLLRPILEEEGINTNKNVKFIRVEE